MKHSDIVYCYYNSKRPSGFFGRALQLKRPVIVKKGGYLDVAHPDYDKKIKLECLTELNDISINHYLEKEQDESKIDYEEIDESEKLYTYLHAIEK